MIIVKCDKCGKNANQLIDGKPANHILGKDLCDKCFKEWKKISTGLEQKIFNSWTSGKINFLDSMEFGKLEHRFYPNRSGTKIYHACPFCGTLYGDSCDVGVPFDCHECHRKVILLDN